MFTIDITAQFNADIKVVSLILMFFVLFMQEYGNIKEKIKAVIKLEISTEKYRIMPL
jgi:hypothetical protein